MRRCQRLLLLTLLLTVFGAAWVLDTRPALAAPLTVTDGADTGAGTLRDTIAAANPGDTIVFAGSVTAVDLTSGELAINKNLTIQGPGANLLTVRRSLSAAADFRVFNITAGTVSISGMTISGGVAPAGDPYGGGISSFGDVTITDCVVSGNSAGAPGGGIAVSAPLTVVRSTIANNTATSGGGIYVQDGVASVVNSTISNNTANLGSNASALQATAASGVARVTVTSSTLVSAATNPAIFINVDVGGTSAALELQSTIVAGGGGLSIDALNGATVTSLGNNLVNPQSDFPSGNSTDVIGTAPNLGPLANNGGPMMTRALLAGSPAIDVGANGLNATDQRGLPRSGAGANADIGAFEVQPPKVDLNGAAAGQDASATYTEGSAPVSIVSSSGLTVSDLDSTNLSGANVKILNPFDGSNEILAADNAGIPGIVVGYNPATSTLILGGNRPIAEYQTVLRTLTYQNTSTNPNTGTRQVRVFLLDSVVSGPPATSNVTIGAVDSPPVNGVPGAQSTNEDTPLVFSSGNGNQISIADPDIGGGSMRVILTATNGTVTLNGTVGLTVNGGANGTSTVAVTGTLAALNTALNGLVFTAPANFFSPPSASLQVQTSDLQGAVPSGPQTDDDTITIIVTSVNDLPTISDIPNQTTPESTAIGPITFTVNDVETAAGSLTLAGTSNNQTLVPDANITFDTSTPGSPKVSVLPAAGQSGLVTITVTVTDGNSGTATDTFQLVVASVNSQPTISPISAQSTAEDTPTAAISVTVGDDETAAANLILTGTSSNQAIVADGGIVFGGSGASRTVTVTPAPNANGPATITVTVHDADGGAASQSFLLTVTPVNDPPTISSIADQSTSEGTAVGPVSFTIGDVETTPSVLTVFGGSSDQALVPDANITFGGSGAGRTVTVTPVAGQTGLVNITLTVRDPQGLQTTDTFALNVGSVLAAGQARLAAQTALSPAQTTAVWLPGAPSQATIFAPVSVPAPILDLSALLGSCAAGTRSLTLPTALDVQRETDGGTIAWSLPAPVTITGPCSWDGKLKLPTPADLSTVLPGGSPARTSLTGIVDFGLGDTPLSFSRAFRLALPGKQGNQAGIVRTGAYAAVTDACANDSQSGADQLAANGLCSRNITSALVVWGKQSGLMVTSNTGCGPRPNVRSALAVGGGALQVTISAVRSDALTTNSLRSVTFGTGTNAVIDVPVQPGVSTALSGAGGSTIQLTGAIVDLTFTVRRVTAGQPTTVPITVVDGCGEWKTFVGGGAGAGF